MVDKLKQNKFLMGSFTTTLLSGSLVWIIQKTSNIDPLIKSVEKNTELIAKMSEINTAQFAALAKLIYEQKAEIVITKTISDNNKESIKEHNKLHEKGVNYGNR